MKDFEVKNVWRACNKISAAIFRVNLNLWDYFRPLDISNHGIISETKFVAVLRGPLRYIVGLSEGEIAELTDYFRLQDGRIHYSQLCKIIHGTVPEFQSESVTTGLEWQDPSEINRLSQTEQRKLHLIITQVAANLNSRNLVLRPYFQDYELIAKTAGTVTITHFGRVLNFLGIILGSNEFALLVKRFTKEPHMVNYVGFVRAIEEAQNFMDQNGMLSASGELLDQFPGRIITAELPKLPRPEIGKVHPSDVLGKQPTFHPSLERKEAPMTILETIYRIQKHVLERRIRVREFFQKLDALNVGRVTISQFKRGLDGLQVSGLGQLYLSELEIDNLVDFYKDPNDPELVLWRVFEDDIDHVFTVKELEKLPELQFESPPQNVVELPKRGLVSWQHTADSLRELCEETIRKVRYRVQERRIMLKQFFKNYDRLNHGYVSKNQVHQVLTTATLLLTPEEMFALEQRYNDEMGFNYAWFLRELDPAPMLVSPYETMLSEMQKLNAEKQQSHSSDEDKNILLILSKIKAKSVRERIEVSDYLRQFDPRNEMMISRHDFVRGLDQLRCNLTLGELETIMDVYRAPLRSGFVEYMRFSRAIQEAISIESLDKSPLLVPLPHVPSEECPRAFLNFEERQAVSLAMNKLAKIQNPNLEEVFKDFDKNHMGTVTKSQLIKTLSLRHILPLISNKELDVVFKCFAIECRDKRLDMDYRSFLRSLEFLKKNKKYLPF